MGPLLSRNRDKMRSKPPAARISEHDRCVLELRLQRSTLNSHAKSIHKFSERQTELAKQLLREGRREESIRCLKRKKLHEGQLAKVDNLLENVERMIQSLEFAVIQQEVASAMSQGTKAIEELHRHMSVDEVEKLMDTAAEAVTMSKEISDLLSQHLTDQDELSVQNELVALELAMAPKVPNQPLPEVTHRENPKVSVGEQSVAAREKATEEEKPARVLLAA